MQDLEQRYFERVHAAQLRFNEALDAARTEHDLEVLAAREELNEKASGRFNVLFGRAPQQAPSEQARSLIASLIEDELSKRFVNAAAKMLDGPAQGAAEKQEDQDTEAA
jgi:hypothetical protein